MREHPILFSGPMVRPLLAGTKTQTRRVVKLPSYAPWMPEKAADKWRFEGTKLYDGNGNLEGEGKCPYGQPGERLWVRETWLKWGIPGEREYYDYAATCPDAAELKWKPSIHMPRAACRLLLEVVSVRVERLQSITEADARAEGVEPVMVPTRNAPPARKWTNYLGRDYCHGMNLNSAVESYQTLWQLINGPGSWDANPYVWVVEFKRIE